MPTSTKTPPKKTKAALKLIKTRQDQAVEDFGPMPEVKVTPVTNADGTVSLSETAKKRERKEERGKRRQFQRDIEFRFLSKLRADPDYAEELAERVENVASMRFSAENAIIQSGKNVLVYTRKVTYEGEVTEVMRTLADFKTLHLNTTIRVPSVKRTSGGKVTVTIVRKKIVDVWLENKYRRNITDVVNAPGQDVGKNVLNLWKGWGVEPAMVPVKDSEGKIIINNQGLPVMRHDYSGNGCKLILKHIFEVLARKDKDLYNWIIAWFADIVQNPTKKKGTALVLYGPQGAGKSFVTEHIFGPILGTAYSAERSTKFLKDDAGNTQAKGKLLIAAEEAIFVGDPSLPAPLKTFITQEKISVRHLFQDAILIKNHCRVIAYMNPAATQGHAAQIEADDRRNTVAEVSAHRVGDTRYFAELMDEVLAGGKEAFFAYLLNPALLEGVDLRRGMDTADKIEQKVLSLPSGEDFIYQSLRASTTQLHLAPEARTPWGMDDEKYVAGCEEFYKGYEKWAKERGKRHILTATAFTKVLKEWLGDPVKGRSSKGVYYWKLGALKTCRGYFAQKIGCKPEWVDRLWDLEAGVTEIEDVIIPSNNYDAALDDKIPF